jgi:hypothetical protein
MATTMKADVMAKTILKHSPVLPDINEQIEYVKHIRKDVIPSIKPLQTELDMIFAIEQSLMAAKLHQFYAANQMKEPETGEKERRSAIKILKSFKIRLSTIRVEVLKAILAQGNDEFTATSIYVKVPRSREVSRTLITTTLDLFLERKLIVKSTTRRQNNTMKAEVRFRYWDQSPTTS